MGEARQREAAAIFCAAAASSRVLLALALLGGCGRAPADFTGSQPGGEHEWFTDAAAESGLDFVHFSGALGEFYFPEIMAAGVGFLDYDHDGDLDIYLVQGQMLGAENTITQALFPRRGSFRPGGRLYRNDLQVHGDGTRRLQFTDVTDQTGIDARKYGMGVAVGDFNNDGCVDLYLTNFGPNQLFRNNCDGTFTDVSSDSATDDAGWGVSASFVDYDRDGWLDLYVGNYLDYETETDQKCFSTTGARDYCAPEVYGAQPDRLYRNEKNGHFVDVTTTALVERAFGPALGVVAADFDGDGWIDIYVANDGQENQLWMNQRDGTLRNAGLLSGTAVNRDGKAEASMGVDAGDFDNDGDEDLFMTHLTGETNTLYVNGGTGLFEDQSARSGLGPPSLSYTGFGTAWVDFDNDGWLDILTVNGRVRAMEALANDPFPYDERNQLFRNLSNGHFEEVTSQAGPMFEVSAVGRGAAFGDVDNDGDTDVLVGNNGGHVSLLINHVGSRNHWLGLRLVGKDARRDMLGARVEVVRKDAATLWRQARADGSYASANDARVLVGLGEAAEVFLVRIYWPSGDVEVWSDVAIERWTTLTEGSGR